MDTAFAAVLLVRASFLNSEFVTNEELPFILAAKALESKTFIWWPILTPRYR